MAATVIAVLVAACAVVAIVRYLVSRPLEEEMMVGCFHSRVLRAVPLQAIKIIVVVWQILIQVCFPSKHNCVGLFFPCWLLFLARTTMTFVFASAGWPSGEKAFARRVHR